MTMKRRPESDVKTRMVKAVNASGGYGRRFEDQFAVGIPDCVFVLPELVPCFAEVKIITDNIFAPTPRQYVELIRIAKSSTKVAACIIGYKPTTETFYIANPTQRVDIRDHKPLWSGTDFIATLQEFLK